MARKKTAVAKKTTDALALSQELQDLFAGAINRDRASSVGAGGWPFVKTSGALFSVSGHAYPDPFTVIAVAAVRQNSYYPGAYDPNDSQGPECYAIDTEGDELTMAPPSELKTKCAELCSDCPMNAWGSAQGRGKACKNGVKIALLPADTKDFAAGEGAILSIGPTSLKPWGEYVRTLNERLGRPIFAIETIFEKEAGEGGGFKILPKPGDVIDDPDKLMLLNDRASKDVWAVLTTPPPAASTESKPAKTRKRRQVVRDVEGPKKTRKKRG